MKQSIAIAACMLGAVGVFWFAQAGDLEPPGSPAPTMTTLDLVEPRTPIQASDLPLEITASGSYYLTENISFGGSADGIIIDAHSVTIDLNGFALSGPGSGVGDGIHVNAGRKGAEIVNGTVRNWGDEGVDAEGASLCVMRGLTVRDNGQAGLVSGSSSLVAECTATNNGGFGIIADDRSVVRGCMLVDNLHGVAVNGAISDSVVTGNAADGILMGGGSSAFRCAVTFNGGKGIVASFANTISGCTLKDNGSHGIEISAGNYVLHNLIDRSGVGEGDGAGIRVLSQANRIEGNNLTGNDWGLDVDDVGNLIIKNSAKGNGTNYDIVSGNDVGPIGSASSSSSPWANIEY